MASKSEIYSQGYQKWDGDRTQVTPPWYLIGRAGVQNILASTGKKSRMFFIIAFVIYYFMLVASTTLRLQIENFKRIEWLAGVLEAWQAAQPAQSEVWYHEAFILRPAIFFTFWTMILYGSQLISKDRAANALQVYFSKAVSRFDYLFGKFFAVAQMTAVVTLVPSAIIICVGLVATTDHLEFIKQSWYIPILTGSFWLLLTITYGSIILLCSSLMNRSYMAGASFFGFAVFTAVFPYILGFIFGAHSFVEGLKWTSSIATIGEAIYSLKVNEAGLLFWQVFDVALVTGVAIFLITRRIEPVEVVK
ncbi:ABC transporter permease subunit [Sulfidibacter corallicola]|uniref:ABC transporter permease subunit n=1 Tax=Sulfidibacter corallicola TaxID=2818388 RepID=A0A8A4TQI5_SULCO|nr:ABC transporter permease subunit [Sulfidibacter corallicola]QTD52246.1 ABC transporter permease subunit [Sulfidibacter corallicola]